MYSELGGELVYMYLFRSQLFVALINHPHLDLCGPKYFSKIGSIEDSGKSCDSKSFLIWIPLKGRKNYFPEMNYMATNCVVVILSLKTSFGKIMIGNLCLCHDWLLVFVNVMSYMLVPMSR